MMHEMSVACRNLSSCSLTSLARTFSSYPKHWLLLQPSVRCLHRLPFLPHKIYINNSLRQVDLSLTMKRAFSPSVPFHYTSLSFEIDWALKVCCRHWSSVQRSCAYWAVSYVISGVCSMLAVRIPFLKTPMWLCLHIENFLPAIYTLSLTVNFRFVLLSFTGEVLTGVNEEIYFWKKANVRKWTALSSR